MAQDWLALTRLTGGRPLVVDRVRLRESGIAIEGSFDLPPLAALEAEDQVFVAAFIRCHGSIKQMEKYFGVSYPSIKSRLNRIGARLPFVELEPASPMPKDDVLDRLERGDMTAAEAIAHLKQKREEGRRE
jgi:hypothetical protein